MAILEVYQTSYGVSSQLPCRRSKKQVTLWYEAFSNNDPTILDRILSENWVDIPSPPGTPTGPTGVKPLLASLKTTFPDLNLTIQDILQDGDKVVVRAEMAGTQTLARAQTASRFCLRQCGRKSTVSDRRNPADLHSLTLTP
jgi:SnoaL-like polyketide cyclase